ncbi:OmpA family protein [Rubrivirga litoralis]|uniref:OmpA family protein n=1 Tax=Rubrivirga litoralis TaxID=3075598 RepID=A0ABU3BT30_9BACT|nr:OmpA family protein [Rubrivirga sp. F394]MDT0632437.1 OmpA family protein [Rubrivirga sp. F394]
MTSPALFLAAVLAVGLAGCSSSAVVYTASRAEAEAAVSEARRAVDRADRSSALAARYDLGAAAAALEAGDLDEAVHQAYLTRRRVRVAALQATLDDAERSVSGADAEGGRRLLITDAFQTAQTDLRPAPREAVARVASYLLSHPHRVVLVEGFTDSTGNEKQNLDLSVRRAAAVKAQLVEAGIDPSRVVAAGYGQAYPVAPNDTAEGQRQNRRIEITVADRLDALPTR